MDEEDRRRHGGIPPQGQKAPSVTHHPAGFSVKAPTPEKREKLMKATEEGERKFEEYKDLRSTKIRELTQGPSKPVGGCYLSPCELDEKWKIEERKSQKQQVIANYEYKQRREEYQKKEREREERKIQEKKDHARELTNKQNRLENDRAVAHNYMIREQRLNHFTSNQKSTSAHSTPASPFELQEKWRSEDEEKIKQQKLEEAAKRERREAYKREERDREEKQIQDKKLQARNLANRQASRERERAAADYDTMIDRRLSRFSDK